MADNSAEWLIAMSRAYQLEMFEESKRQNVIVAMPTGTGKTHIAILRIQYELERCPVDQIIWFLAPTVELAKQQGRKMSAALPQFRSKSFVGKDGVDHWKSKLVWDTALHGVRIAISTHQVLYDALFHGFVRMESIALLVFDEAHHCIKNHAGNRIMNVFYHNALPGTNVRSRPHILGLSASLATSPKASLVRKLEQNLASVCRTPTEHKEELARHANQPSLREMDVVGNVSGLSKFLLDFIHACKNADISQDPKVLRLRKFPDPDSTTSLINILGGRGLTGSQKQLKKLVSSVTTLHYELGEGAAENFAVWLLKSVQHGKGSSSLFQDFFNSDLEQSTYIASVLSSVRIPAARAFDSPAAPGLSPKVQRLIDMLSEQPPDKLTGLIFVRERVLAVMLAKTLSEHLVPHNISTAAFVGQAGGKNASDMGKIHDLREQEQSLSSFREGKTNLLVTTSALEEGIDVPSCQLVICFQTPPEVRSFIQRRGRARQKTSCFIIFRDERDPNVNKDFVLQEKAMQEIYMSPEEHARRKELDESTPEAEFRISRTGAVLIQTEAVRILNHFCATLQTGTTTAASARYILSKNTSVSSNGLFALTAKVVLPSIVDRTLRVHHGDRSWFLESRAKSDAAFQACLHLYEAGLITDHLMPAHFLNETTVPKRTGTTKAMTLTNPWAKLAMDLKPEQDLYMTSIEISSASGHERLDTMYLLTPSQLALAEKISLLWDRDLRYNVQVKSCSKMFPGEFRQAAVRISKKHYDIAYPNQHFDENADFVCLFIPSLDPRTLAQWNDAHHDIPFEMHGVSHPIRAEDMIVKVPEFNSHRASYIKDFILTVPSGNAGNELKDTRFVEMKYLPRRRDLHNKDAPTNKGKGTTLQHATRCVVEGLPASNVKFSIMIPALLHHIELKLIAHDLCATVLRSLDFQDEDLVLTAICAPNSKLSFNYDRLEFLGDSLLKFHTSLQLIATRSTWHEGLLTIEKSALVSNDTLYKASLRLGLDKYAINDPNFSVSRSGRTIAEIFEEELGTTERTAPTKLLADIVESLIGVSHLEGGENKVSDALRLIIPQEAWLEPEHCRRILYDAAAERAQHSKLNPDTLKPVESMVGYTFRNKDLLQEALTHATYGLEQATTYQRLEFLGDAVLDQLIVSRLFKDETLDHAALTQYRAAISNGHTLGFLCLNLKTEVTTYDINIDATGHPQSTARVEPVFLWHHMRHGSPEVIAEHEKVARQLHLYADKIQTALESDGDFPWIPLLGLGLNKFWSDLVESILGAIYIDSDGSEDACNEFLDRLGLNALIDRMMRDNVDVLHPKAQLALLSGNTTIDYEYEIASRESPSSCRIKIGEEIFEPVIGARTHRDAEAIAAHAAVTILRTRKMDNDARRSRMPVDTESGADEVISGVASADNASTGGDIEMSGST